MYYVGVFLEMGVKDDLHLDLLRSEATMLERMLLIDELDGDDGLRCVCGCSFSDGCVCALPNGFADEAEGKVRREWSDLALE